VSFAFVKRGDLELLVYEPWLAAGILHGMTTTAIDFSKDTMPEALHRLSMALGVTEIAIPAQHHGTTVLDLTAIEATEAMIAQQGDLVRRAAADAVLAPSRQILPSKRIAYGVVTADCIPILIRTPHAWAAVHAGWRGLADGVVEEALARLGPVDNAEVAIFACAGAEAYEVGGEVIEALGATAVCTPQGGSKYLLNLEASARSRLLACVPRATISVASTCTITDTRFHSFRRDGERAGRALSFMVPPV